MVAEWITGVANADPSMILVWMLCAFILGTVSGAAMVGNSLKHVYFNGNIR